MRNSRILINLFRTSCIIMACFVIWKQFEIYKRSSEKVETISFRRFGTKAHDQYPTFTYCFYIEKRSSTFDEISNLEETILENDLQDGVLFDDVIFTEENSYGTRNSMFWYKGRLSNKKKTSPNVPTSDNANTDFPFIRKIEWMQKYALAGLCYTRLHENVSSGTRIHDTVVVNVSRIMEKDAQINVYIHHPGQLMRSLDYPAYIYRREHLCFNEYNQVYNPSHPSGMCYSRYSAHDVRMNYVSVMRLDPNAGEWRPCDKELMDEDLEKKRYIVKQLECIPRFWNNSRVNLDIELPKCENASVESFTKLYRDLKFADENPGNNLHRKSCNKMTVLQTITHNPSDDVSINSDFWRMQLKFYYPPQGR